MALVGSQPKSTSTILKKPKKTGQGRGGPNTRRVSKNDKRIRKPYRGQGR